MTPPSETSRPAHADGAPALGGPRRLAFVYHPLSFATMAVANAAQEVCELTWVVDTTMPEVSSMSRLLRRLGDVVDVAGMSLDEAAASVAAARPDGILALHDSLLVWTAGVAQRLRLPANSPQVAERLADKYAQRAALQSGGVPVPGFWLIPDAHDEEALTALAVQARFPAMLKPRRSAGSRDVVAVGSAAELRARLAETPERLGSELLLEEYLGDRPADAGEDFAAYASVESIVSGGRVSHLAITGRFPLAEPFRETALFIPAAFDALDGAAMLALASDAIAAIGVSAGCLHTEIKLTPDGPRVIELNGRIGGPIPELLAAAADVEMLGIAMRLALGETIVYEETLPCTQVAFVLWVQPPASMRRIISVDGLDELRSDPDVHQVILNRGPGHDVHWRDGSWGHVFSVHGAVADHEQLKVLARRVYADTRITGA